MPSIILSLRNVGIIEGDGASFIDVVVEVSLHLNPKNQIICKRCEEKRYWYTPLVRAMSLQKISPQDLNPDEEERILTRIKLTVERILSNLPSCFIKREQDEEHEGYIEELFYEYANCKLKKFYFE